MVKANLKIYPLPIITRDFYNKFSHKLTELEGFTKTSIAYNFDERCFEITADEQKCCYHAETIIIQNLLPNLNQAIDREFMLGTYEDLSMIKIVSDEPMHTPTPTHLPRIILPGKPLVMETENQEEGDDEHEHEHEQQQNEEGRQLNMEQDQLYDSEALVIKTFIISSEIRNIDDFLIGPVQHNMQNAVYLKLIPKMTYTDCTLNGRSIKIEGSPNNVKDAYQKFAVIQKTYIGLSKKTLVPCLHFHNSNTFRLYFCNLPRYRYHSFVQHHYEKYETPADYHIILPVFLDKNTNEFTNPPKDLIMANSEQQTNDQANSPLDKTMQLVQDAMKQSNIRQEAPSQSSSHNSPEADSNDSDRFRPPLWGLDRNFTTAYNTGELEYITSERLSRAFTPPPPPSRSSTSNMPMLKDFPLLQADLQHTPRKSTAYKPTLSINTMPQQRRILRIVPQKAARSVPSPTPSISQLDRVKDYNYNNIKNALSKGLESVRGFKGELKLYAKIGKVLWNVRSPEVNSKIWQFDEIIDIIVREYGTIPKFTSMTTRDERVINLLASDEIIKGAHFVSKTAIYEFHCLARNSPSLPYTPTVIHMNQGVIDVRKVVINDQTVAEVDWVSLDRRYDFQLALTATQLTRCDVKPYTSFNKRVSVCPITRNMSFENVSGFLDVKYVIFKQTTRYTYILPFVIDIIRVEKVPLRPVSDSRKINAFPGTGEAWYDFEIHNTLHDAPFKSNLGLEIGSEASWKVEDILQYHNNDNDTITNYVKNLIILIERIENALKKMSQ